MTTDIKPGRQFDGLLGRYFFQWPEDRVGPDCHGENEGVVLRPPDLPRYYNYPPKGEIPYYYHCKQWSTDNERAWELAETLRSRGWLVVIKLMPDGLPFLSSPESDIKVKARFLCELHWMRDQPPPVKVWKPFGCGDTLAEAISRAALATCEETS